MLRSIENVKGFTVQATDGEIGELAELFFDEQSWRVRYLVIDVGVWLFGRQVLIAPTAVTDIDVAAGKLFLNLSKEAIENSPDVSADEPVSREKERALHEYYQWQPYWTSGMDDPLVYGAFPTALTGALFNNKRKNGAEERPLIKREQSSYLRSTTEVSGYHIEASDGDIGRVTDFFFDDQKWMIRHMVVDTGSWLPGKKVLIAPPWIDDIQWAERKVTVALTQESVKQSPPYDPTLLGIEAYETKLLDHYRDWFAYLLDDEQEDQKHGEKSA